MKLTIIEKIIGSGLFTGYFPYASGTVGSFAAVLIYLIPGFENPSVMLFFISFFTAIGIPISTKFEKIYGKDPAQCTIDEFVGTWISLLFVPKKAIFIVIAFIIWRILDIFKPFPARQIENIKGGIGIMFDDIVSGLYALVIIHVIINLISRIY
jgi:phosphatidylglycerophosphatase A